MTLPDTLDALETGSYRNTRQIPLGGVMFSARDVLIKAPLMAKLNVYLVGGTGEGKTELASDMVGYFGPNACYEKGRLNFEPDELLKRVRLDKLRDVKTDKELVELTENVKKNFFYIDELNRCPPIVQNYFFDFFDGKLVYDGKIMPLGTDGYMLGFATGNLGNGEYVGVSDSDRALLDRMHMIMKLDHPDYATTEGDDYAIFRSKKNPRASLPTGDDLTREIIAMHRAFGEQEVNPLLPILGVYFSKGLDYVENDSRHSKRALGPSWNRAEGVRTDNDENKIHPLSKRAVLGAMGLSSALEMIARARGKEPQAVPLFLDSLRLTIPYSGVISPAFVDMNHDGDVYSAFDALFGTDSRNREEIMEKAPLLEEANLLARAGISNPRLFSEIAPTESRWSAVSRALSGYAQEQNANPSDESRKLKKALKLKDVIEAAHGESK